MTQEEEKKLCLNCNCLPDCAGIRSPFCAIKQRLDSEMKEGKEHKFLRIAKEQGYTAASKAAVAMYTAGKSGHEILEMFDCSTYSVMSWLKKEGIKPKRMDWGGITYSSHKQKRRNYASESAAAISSEICGY